MEKMKSSVRDDPPDFMEVKEFLRATSPASMTDTMGRDLGTYLWVQTVERRGGFGRGSRWDEANHKSDYATRRNIRRCLNR